MDDPRLDLKMDSQLWEKLFSIVDDDELRGKLHGIRCYGTLIVQMRGQYTLKPVVSKGNWESIDEFKETASKHLDKKEVGKLLSKL